MIDIKIRRAIESDVSQLEELFLITRQQTFKWENPLKFKLADYLTSTKEETVFIAEDNKKIIGFISIWEKDHPTFIHNLFIAKSYQRKGVGTLLIHHLFDCLPRPYQLKCLSKNTNALNFYLKNGWIKLDKSMSEDGEYFLLELS